MYVCFNRPLADRIEQLVPAGERVATFHMLGDAFMRAQAIMPDYASPTYRARKELMQERK